LDILLFYCDGRHRDLHYFPTRRSSDLTCSTLLHILPTTYTHYNYTHLSILKILRAYSKVVKTYDFVLKHLSQKYLKNNKYNQKIDRKSTRLNSSHVKISYAVFCLKKKR